MTGVYRKATSTDRGGETRAMRGLALYRERGDEIVVYVSGGFGVPSRTEPGFLYFVDLDREEARERCDCPDASYGGHTCMHQVFVEAHLTAKRRGAAGVRRLAPVRSGRRCERKAA